MIEPAGKPLVVGNWKMNVVESRVPSLVAEIVDRLPFARVDAAVAPAFPCLRAALDAAAGTPLGVGAQTMHWDDSGAFTGEVAPGMLAEMGVRFVILGHSERRTLFGETDDDVARKVAAAFRHGLVPIVCVGETEAERGAGTSHAVIQRQVRAAFSTRGPAGRFPVVAYEPVWAIGTGRTPQPGEITDAHREIQDALTDRFGTEASGIRILYGGSVTAGNAAQLLRAPGVDGALVGGASLLAGTFASIAEAVAPC